MTAVMDFINRNYGLLVLVLFIGVVWLTTKIIQRRREKKELKEVEAEEILSDKPVKEDVSFDDIFMGRKKESEEKVDISEHIEKFGEFVRGDGAKLDDSLRKEFDRLHARLQEIEQKKRQIEKNGKDLVVLYDKYRSAEKYITEIMKQMEIAFKSGTRPRESISPPKV